MVPYFVSAQDPVLGVSMVGMHCALSMETPMTGSLNLLNLKVNSKRSVNPFVTEEEAGLRKFSLNKLC